MFTRAVTEATPLSKSNGRPGTETELLSAIVATQQEIATSGREVDAVMRLIAHRTQRLTGATGAVLELAEGDEMVYRAATGTAAPSVGVRLKSATSLSGLCVRTGDVLRCDDAEVDGRVDREACRRVGVRSMVVVPLRYDGRVVGVLKVLSDRPEAFDDRDAHTLQLMTGLLGAALGNASAFEAERARVAERTEMLRAETVERRRTEDSLRASEEMSRLLVEGVRDHALILLDPAGGVVTWNSGAEVLFGYTAGEAVGRPFARFFPAEDVAAGTPQAELDRAAAHGGSETVGWRVRKDGSRFWASGVLTTLYLAAGGVRGFAKITRDLTDRKRLEDQLHQAQKMEAVGRLAGGVAHDFNNLLTVINGYADLLRGRLPAGAPDREMAHEIHQAGERAAALTRQLLAFSRQQVLEPTVLDLNAVVAKVGKMLRRLVGEDVDLATAPAPGLWPVRADAGQVEQVLLNLVVNARDAMPTGGRLTVETANVDLSDGYAAARPGRYVLLAVSDTGCGMTAEVQARIFEPFFTTKGLGRGTGLGLATVHGIVNQSGGFVAVYSEPGRGATFKVYLPAVERPVGAEPAVAGPAAPLRGDETVLVVEDDEAVRAVVCLALRSQGYTVLEAGRGREAVRAAETHAVPIHLLVTDVVMPEMGGRAVAETLVARRPGLKVLYLSGYTDDAVVRHGVLEAHVHFLQKPFAPGKLAAKVRQILDGR